MPGILHSCVYILEGSYLLGILQPKLSGTYTDWERTFHVCTGALEDVQDICVEKLRIDITFAVCRNEIMLESIGRIYHLLKRKLISIPRKKDIGIMMVSMEELPGGGMDNKNGLIVLPALSSYLEQGNYDECRKTLKTATMPLLGTASTHDMKALELYYNISMIYLKFINANNWEEKIPFYIGLYSLTRADNFASWEEAVEYLNKLTEVIFGLIRECDEYHKDQALVRVKR